MKKIAVPAVIALVLIGGVVFFLTRGGKSKTTAPVKTDASADASDSNIVPVSSSVTVDVKKSTTKDNTVVLSVAGMGGKYASVAYELTYDTKGVMQGVTSQPVDVSGKDTFVRDDIYLGTCSKNVCTPHTGVTKISAVLEFKTADGKKSEFDKDFDL